MQPQLSAFTHKLIRAAKAAFFCFSFLQILNVGPSDLLKGLEQHHLGGGGDVSHRFPFIYLRSCKHNHLGKSQKNWWITANKSRNSASGSQRQFCLSMQSSWCAFKSCVWYTVTTHCLSASARHKQYASEDDSRPFLSRFFLPESHWCRISKFPLKIPFISRLRKPNIKYLEAGDKSCMILSPSFGLYKGAVCHLWAYRWHAALTKIWSWRWMLCMNTPTHLQ